MFLQRSQTTSRWSSGSRDGGKSPPVFTRSFLGGVWKKKDGAGGEEDRIFASLSPNSRREGKGRLFSCARLRRVKSEEDINDQQGAKRGGAVSAIQGPLLRRPEPSASEWLAR